MVALIGQGCLFRKSYFLEGHLLESGRLLDHSRYVSFSFLHQQTTKLGPQRIIVKTSNASQLPLLVDSSMVELKLRTASLNMSNARMSINMNGPHLFFEGLGSEFNNFFHREKTQSETSS